MTYKLNDLILCRMKVKLRNVYDHTKTYEKTIYNFFKDNKWPHQFTPCDLPEGMIVAVTDEGIPYLEEELIL